MNDFFEKYADRIMPLPTTGCWLWIGSQATNGYGTLTRDRRSWYAHRAAYEAIHSEGAAKQSPVIRHRCDLPCCVNPDHLVSGTHQDNAQDKLSRGRANSPRGESNGGARLSDQQVQDVRERVAAGEMVADIARNLGLPHSTVSAAVKGESWSHLPGAQPVGIRRGDRCTHAILRTSDVLAIRQRRRGGAKLETLAGEYGVSVPTISAIAKRRIWRHV